MLKIKRGKGAKIGSRKVKKVRTLKRYKGKQG